MCVSIHRAMKNTLYIAPVQVKLQSGKKKKKKDTLMLRHFSVQDKGEKTLRCPCDRVPVRNRAIFTLKQDVINKNNICSLLQLRASEAVISALS